MRGISNVTKMVSKITKERREILEKVVEKAFKDNKAVFDRLDEI